MLLGIDAGTTIVKSVIFDFQGNEIAVARAPIVFDTPHNGWAEQDMEKLWEAVIKTVKVVIKNSKIPPRKIQAIGITGQGDGCWLIDKKGNPLRKAILWCDSRSDKIIANWQRKGISEKIFSQNGNAVFTGAHASILSWLKTNELHSLRKAYKAFFCKDWLLYKFTGEIVTDESDASCIYFSNNYRKYSDSILSLINLSKFRYLLPTVVPNYLVAGSVSKEVSSITGLLAGTPVSNGPYDIIATLLGTGGINEGDAVTILGTACVNEVATDRPVLQPANIGMTRCHGLAEKWVRVIPMMMGTPSLDWFIQEFISPKKKKDKFQELELKIAQLPIGSEGIIYHPYLSPSGERAPFIKPAAKAQFFGLSSCHTKYHLLRAIYEGITLAILDCYQHLPLQLSRVRVAGGGARSSLWCQMIADCLGVFVERPIGVEIGAKGAALSAGVATNIYQNFQEAVRKTVKIDRVFTPENENVKKYRQLYNLYTQIYRDVWDDWERRKKMLISFS